MMSGVPPRAHCSYTRSSSSVTNPSSLARVSAVAVLKTRPATSRGPRRSGAKSGEPASIPVLVVDRGALADAHQLAALVGPARLVDQEHHRPEAALLPVGVDQSDRRGDRIAGADR